MFKKRNFYIIFSLCILTLSTLYITSFLLKSSERNNPFRTRVLANNEIRTNAHLPERKTSIQPLPWAESKTDQNPVSTELKIINTDNAGSQPPNTDNELTEQISSESSGNKTVYLTFDDGPKNISTTLLSILDQFGAKATFFMIDGNIRNYPDIAKQMIASGHTVGSHSVSHSQKQFYQSRDTVVNEMQQTRNTIKEITGVDSLLIRTPYGSAPYMTPEYKQALIEHGLVMWDWNVDSKDWYYRDHRMIETVIAQIESKKNQTSPIVILFHEQEETAVYLPELLQYLTSQQYSLQALNPSIAPIQF